MNDGAGPAPLVDDWALAVERLRGYTGESSRLVLELRDLFAVRTLQSLLGLTTIVREDLPSLAAEAGLDVALGLAMDRWSSFLELAREPLLVCWVSLLKDLVPPGAGTRVARNDVDLHVGATGSRRDVFLCDHLVGFGAFATAAAIRAGVDLDLPRAPRLPWAWLPGTAVEWPVAGGELGPGELLGAHARAPLWRDASTRTPRAMPVIEAHGGRVRIHANAPAFHLRHVERWERILEHRARERFAEGLRRGLDRADEHVPGFSAQTMLLVDTCVPMTTRGVVAMASGSYTRLQGAIFVAESDDPDLTAEMLIHEVSHTKLSLLEDVAPFFEGFSRSRSGHYSPWRDELRSAEGVLHALYVHCEILRFWIGRHDRTADDGRRELCRRRICTLLGQMRLGHDDLERTGEFTKVGRALFYAIDRDVRAWEEAFAARDPGVRPFFSEMKRDPALASLDLATALERHRASVWVEEERT